MLSRVHQRACVAFIGFFLALLLLAKPAASDPLPTSLQAELIVKLAGYDRNMRTRAREQVRVLIATRDDNNDDARWAAQLTAALGRSERIAGLPHGESTVTYSRADALAAQCKSERISIVVFAPSLGGEAERMRVAFDGANVLTVTPDQDLVRRGGAVLGFELVSGKPKLFLHQPQATRQNVVISAEVMKLMTVYQ